MGKLKKGLICLFLLLLYPFCGGCGGHEHDYPAAVVNGQTITKQQLDHFIRVLCLHQPADLLLDTGQEQERRAIEAEFLRILIDMELMRQAVEKAGLTVNEELVKRETDLLLAELIAVQYGGSRDLFNRRLKHLELTEGDLSILPRYELQRQLLFDHIAASLTESDLRAFVEENPEIFKKAAALQVCQLTFSEEELARRVLVQFEKGRAFGELVGELQREKPDLEAGTPEWISASDPFLDEGVKNLLFNLAPGEKGAVVEGESCFHLYLILDSRPASSLDYEAVKEEAALMKQCMLYEDYYYRLWSEGDIEILMH